MFDKLKNLPRNHYVYVYLRSDKTYYYVGKGVGRRAWVSHKRKNGTQLRPNHNDLIQIIAHDLNEHEAYLLESKLISYYGFKHNGGILVNLKHGGLGGRTSPELRDIQKQIHNSPETKNKHIQATRASWQNTEIRNKRLASINNTDTTLSKSNKVKKSWEDEAVRATRIASILQTTATDEYKLMRSLRVGMKANRADRTIYEFERDDGIIEKCTRIELCEKYDLSKKGIGKVVNGARVYKGWKLKNV